jgi:hypothetical protein
MRPINQGFEHGVIPGPGRLVEFPMETEGSAQSFSRGGIADEDLVD